MLSASDKKNIFVTVKIGILTLLGQIFLAIGPMIKFKLKLINLIKMSRTGVTGKFTTGE
jgi:hypothetical protein